MFEMVVSPVESNLMNVLQTKCIFVVFQPAGCSLPSGELKLLERWKHCDQSGRKPSLGVRPEKVSLWKKLKTNGETVIWLLTGSNSGFNSSSRLFTFTRYIYRVWWLMVFCADLCVFGNSYLQYFFSPLSISNTSETFPISTTKNITCVGVSPDGNVAIVVDEGLGRNSSVVRCDQNNVHRTTATQTVCLCCRWSRIVGQSHHASRPSSLPLPQTCQQHLFLTWRQVRNFRTFNLVLYRNEKVNSGCL